ncbi:restriction endonuclease subunit S [Priestia megaterium]|uniref:restriction endonuclease subunit S n=1 Tax=Priestia megaterium TaxID=1404 RepID=UPI003459A0A7
MMINLNSIHSNHNWSESPLSTLLVLLKDGTHNPPKRSDIGIPMLSAVNIQNGKIIFEENFSLIGEEDYKEIHKKYEIQAGDVLLTVVGTLGRVAEVPKLDTKFTVQRSVAILRADNDLLNPRYLRYYIESFDFQKQLKVRSNVTAQAGVYLGELGKIQIRFPNLEEQSKIAAILSSVDEAIEKTEAIIEQTEEVKKGLMQQLLTKGIGHENFKKTDIGKIPDEWEVVKMGDVIELISGQSSSINEINYERKGIAYVTGPEQWNGYHIEETKWVEKPRKIAKENSIFITVKGSGVGTIFLGGYYAIGRDVMAIVPSEIINKDYLYYLALYQARKIVYNKVGIVPGISRGDILEFKFGLPKIDEQVRISKVLTSWDKKLTIEKNKRLKLRELKNGLMQSLLTGKVRVKVNEAEVTQL